MSLRGRFCETPRPGQGHRACVLDFPHPGKVHFDGRDSWSGSHHGDPGHIIDVALDFAGETLVDRVAISLMVAFGRVEPDNSISRWPASTVASFADMARAVIAQFDVHDRGTVADLAMVEGCGTCGVAVRRHPETKFHAGPDRCYSFIEPTGEQQDERRAARRLANEERIFGHG